MDRPLEASKINFWDIFTPMAKRVADPLGDARWNQLPLNEKRVKLSFETQRIRRAKTVAPISEIMIEATPTESLSFAATIPIKVQAKVRALEGFTMQTKITLQDFKRSQAFVLISTSVMGLCTGLLIAYFMQ